MLTITSRAAVPPGRRQEQVWRLRETIVGLNCGLSVYPGLLVDALESEPWAHQRLGRRGERIREMEFRQFVERAHPFGLGASVPTLHRLLAAAAPWAAPADVVAASNLLNRTLKEGQR